MYGSWMQQTTQGSRILSGAFTALDARCGCECVSAPARYDTEESLLGGGLRGSGQGQGFVQDALRQAPSSRLSYGEIEGARAKALHGRLLHKPSLREGPLSPTLCAPEGRFSEVRHHTGTVRRNASGASRFMRDMWEATFSSEWSVWQDRGPACGPQSFDQGGTRTSMLALQSGHRVVSGQSSHPSPRRRVSGTELRLIAPVAASGRVGRHA